MIFKYYAWASYARDQWLSFEGQTLGYYFDPAFEVRTILYSITNNTTGKHCSIC